jgi:ABC-type transport system substrate-binding protein
MGYDDENNLVPDLAKSLEASDDLLTWTMELNSGVVFHDDTPVNADSVVKHFNRLKDPATACSCLDTAKIIASMDMPDGPTGLKVIFHLATATVAFNSDLAGAFGYIESPTAIAKDPEGFKTKPVGSGPFVLTEFTKGERVVLTKWAKYWKKDDAGNQLPYLDKLTVIPLADASQRLNALKAGNIQMFQTATSNVVKQAEDAGFAAQRISGSSSTIILMNESKPPFNNVKARQALAYAIDKSVINERAYDGIRVESYSAFAPDSPYFNKKALTPKYDPKKAEALVKEIGGLEFTLECIPTPEAQEILEIIKAEGEAVGMKINLKTQEQGAYVVRMFSKAGDYEAACFRNNHFIEPDQIRDGLTTGDSGNLVFYSNKEVDRLLDEGRKTAVFEERKAAYDKVQEIIAEELPSITTLYDLFGNVYDKSKAGPPPHPEPNSLGAIKPGYLHLA